MNLIQSVCLIPQLRGFIVTLIYYCIRSSGCQQRSSDAPGWFQYFIENSLSYLLISFLFLNLECCPHDVANPDSPGVQSLASNDA